LVSGKIHHASFAYPLPSGENNAAAIRHPPLFNDAADFWLGFGYFQRRFVIDYFYQNKKAVSARHYSDLGGYGIARGFAKHLVKFLIL